MLKLRMLFLCGMALCAASCATSPTAVAPSASVGAAPTATAAPAGQKVIRMNTVVGTDIRDIPTFMAFDALKTQGYAIQQADVATSSIVVTALAHGDAELGSFNNQTAWDAIAKGAKIRAVVARYAASPLIGVAKQIKTCGDLDGKPVALSGTSGYVPTLFNLYLKANCPASKPKILVIADAAARSAAMQSGSVVAAQVEPQDIVELDKAAPGQFYTLVALEQAFPKLRGSGFYVRQDWAQQNPAAVRDFIRALLLADRQVDENPQLLFSQAVSRLGLDPEVAQKAGTMHLAYNTWDGNGALTTDSIQYTLDFFAKVDPAIAGLRVDDVADLSYLNAVLDEIGRK